MTNNPETCIGFVECPCSKCRARRLDATERHGAHIHGDKPYCGACRTADLAAHRVR